MKFEKVIKKHNLKQTLFGNRKKCYTCYRPKSSCMCCEIQAFDTQTKFIILMHPKEFKKTKNNTGRFTHLSLRNSELFINNDFTNHKRVNEIINTYESYILYPSKNAINLSKNRLKLSNKRAIFIIDSTWSCAVSILKKSKNLQNLNYISFDNTKKSEYKIKEQPAHYCLSTIESTLCILELFNKHNIENISQNHLDNFLNPFYKMVDYQLSCISKSNDNFIRFKNHL
jgi:DTW domain-containing protein YfiP